MATITFPWERLPLELQHRVMEFFVLSSFEEYNPGERPDEIDHLAGISHAFGVYVCLRSLQQAYTQIEPHKRDLEERLIDSEHSGDSNEALRDHWEIVTGQMLIPMRKRQIYQTIRRIERQWEAREDKKLEETNSDS